MVTDWKPVVIWPPIELDDNARIIRILLRNYADLGKILQDYYWNINFWIVRQEDKISDFTNFINSLVELDEEELNIFNLYCLNELQNASSGLIKSKLSGWINSELSTKLYENMKEMLKQKWTDNQKVE